MLRRSTFLLMIVALCAVPRIVHADASGDLVEQIVKLLGHPDREFRAAALEKVRTAAKGTAHTQTFAAQLPKLDASAQAALITALGDRGDAAARPAVLEQLNNSTDEEVRAAALAALGEIGTPSDLPILVKAADLRRPPPNSRRLVRRSSACGIPPWSRRLPPNRRPQARNCAAN